MTQLSEFLFPPADYKRTTLSTLTWWESRRGIYNVVVGVTGLFTLLVIRVISWTPPGIQADIGWQPIVVYALMANVCYTFGFGVDWLLQRILGKRGPAIAPALFRQGLGFSVGLTLLPIVVASATWVVRLALLLFGQRHV